MNAVSSIWNGLDWSVLTNILIRIIPALICITLHELSHALVALALGDTTARDAGRITLNPIRHLDPMGILMLLVFGFGWANPVPVDARRLRHPKRDMALTALAGPASNLVIGVVFLFLYGFLFFPLRGYEHSGFLLQTVHTTATLSLAYAIFNMIPISPLDGSKVLYSVLPERAYWTILRYERYGMILLFVLVFLFNRIGSPISAATYWLYDRLFFAAEGGFRLFSLFSGS